MEVWRDIPGWESLFQASDLGRIRSCPRWIPTKGGGFRFWGGSIRRTHPAKTTGYHVITLQADGRSEWLAVHRLICRTFHGEAPDGHVAAHLDGSKANNRADNLAWVTQLENASHRDNHGTALRGERNHVARIDAAQATEVRRRANAGESYASIGRSIGYTGMGVSHIVCRRTWGHVA